jgi:DNA-binding response OmpR family regulator
MLNHVLVCEESPVIRELCVELLAAAGFSVDTVDDTTGVPDALAGNDYSFIVFGGFAADSLDSIRTAQEAAGKYAPVIGVCCDAAEVEDCICTPISMSSLKQTFDRWVHYARGRSGATAAA